MSHIQPSPLLQRALWLDIVGSGAVTALQLAATDPLARLTQLPQPLLLESGLFMLLYVVLLLGMVRARRLPLALVRLVIAGNAAWAVAALALAVVLAPTAWGLALLAVHAGAVLLFAALQQMGLRQSLPAPAGALPAR